MIREKIKEEALLLFNIKGYEAATMREIAARVGITAASIYSHYKSKEELYIEILRDSTDKYARYINESFKESEGKPLEERFFEIFKAIINFFKYNHEDFKLLVRVVTFPDIDLKERIVTETGISMSTGIDMITDMFLEGIKENILKKYSMEKLINSFYYFAIGYLFQLISLNSYPSEEEIKDTWEILWRGIKN